MLKKIGKQILAYTLCVSLGITGCIFGNGQRGGSWQETIQAAGYGISNPRISGGVSTWDCIYFGNYWQEDTNGDGVANQSDEKQPIKWRVLSVKGNDACLLADKCLDCKPYNYTYSIVNWKNCTLRKWLNIDFMMDAFDSVERNYIKKKKVYKKIKDYIYLPSYKVMTGSEYGFDDSFDDVSAKRQAKNTTYAMMRGAYTSEMKTGYYWLRSKMKNSDAVYISNYGLGDSYGLGVNTSTHAVRPMLHINLDSSWWTKAGTVDSTGNTISTPTAIPIPTAAPTITPTVTPTPTPIATVKPTATPTPTVVPTATPVTTPSTTVVPSSQPASIMEMLSRVEKNDMTITARQTEATENSVTIQVDGAIGAGFFLVASGATQVASSGTSTIKLENLEENTEYRFEVYAAWGNVEALLIDSYASTTVTVKTKRHQEAPQIYAEDNIRKTYGEKRFPLAVSSNSDGVLRYQSSNSKVVRVSSTGQITIYGYGEARITVTIDETEFYTKGSKTINITIVPDKLKGFKVTSPKKGKILARWKMDKTVKRCELFIADNKNFKNAYRYTMKVKKKKYQIGANRRKRFYVRMRSYIIVNGNTYYSAWTSTKKVKTK